MIRERLENDRGELPWQTIRWRYGTAYMSGIPFVYFASGGELWNAAASAAVGFVILCLLALLAWRWSI